MKKRSLYILLIFSIFILTIGCGANDSESLDTQLSLGQKYLLEENYQEAIVAFEKAIEIDNKCIEAYIGAADAYVGMDEIDKAIAILEKGYDKTGAEELKAKSEELSVTNNDAETIKVTGYIIDNTVEYQEQSDKLSQKYGDMYGIIGNGIRFKKPVNTTVDGEQVEIYEAAIIIVDEKMDDVLLPNTEEEYDNTNWPYFNKEITFTGYFTVDGNERNAEGVFFSESLAVYDPNGKYTFNIVSFEE